MTHVGRTTPHAMGCAREFGDGNDRDWKRLGWNGQNTETHMSFAAIDAMGTMSVV
jgi:hypothetical protein